MNTKNVKKANPTKEESKLAVKAQSPIDETIHETKPKTDSTAVARVSTFRELAKVSRDARIAFGGTSQWVKPENLFSSDYEDGQISPPFFVTKAFRYESKGGFGSRIGIEIVLSNRAMYLVGFPLNEGDIKRNNLIEMFKDANAAPMGPFCLVLLPTNKGNDYYDLVPYEGQKSQQSDEIPFVAIDSDVPF